MENKQFLDYIKDEPLKIGKRISGGDMYDMHTYYHYWGRWKFSKDRVLIVRLYKHYENSDTWYFNDLAIERKVFYNIFTKEDKISPKLLTEDDKKLIVNRIKELFNHKPSLNDYV